MVNRKLIQIVLTTICFLSIVMIMWVFHRFDQRRLHDLQIINTTNENLIKALERVGYEVGEPDSGATLVPFGYDWRQPLGQTGRITLTNDIQSLVNIPNSNKKA